MALKFVVDTLDGVPPAVREHYTAKDGKYQLTLDGEHPDSVRVAEFRENNVKMQKQLARFEGIDPEAVKANEKKLADFENAKPNERIAELESKLTTMQASANASLLKDAVTAAFLRAGGRGSATEFIVGKAAEKLAVENGVIVGKVFDPNRPGEKLTVDGFIAMQVRESDFAFLPSSGGGAPPNSGGGGPSRSNELRNPTPQQLGAHAADIRSGKMKVVFDT